MIESIISEASGESYRLLSSNLYWPFEIAPSWMNMHSDNKLNLRYDHPFSLADLEELDVNLISEGWSYFVNRTSILPEYLNSDPLCR